MSEALQTREVVTAFVRQSGQILLLRRSERVGSYRGSWAAVSGFLEDPTPLAQALREISEETGLRQEQLELVTAAPTLSVEARELGTRWLIHPFLFELVEPGPIRLNWENSEWTWTTPAQLVDYETVPRLGETLQACLEHERLASR